MYYIGTMTKTTIKLLLRNKGFLFFALILPILATLILNVKDAADETNQAGTVTELENMDVKLAYLNDYSMLSVKVYDGSNSKVAQSLLAELSQEGLFQIYRVDTHNYTANEVLENAKSSAMKDKMGAILIINNSFEKELFAGKINDSITLYATEDDERFDLLTQTTESILTKYVALGEKAEDSSKLIELIKKSSDAVYKVTSTEYDVDNSDTTNFDVDFGKTGVLGYALAIYSIAFLLSGIMILNVIFKEKEQLVYTRIMLTKASALSYMVAKANVIFLATFIETGVIGVAYQLLVTKTTGLSLPQFMLLIFLMGLIFNSMSVCIGLTCGDVLSATYISFFIWMTSALLSGLYFDISPASDTMQRIAMLMPQRWTLLSASMMFQGNSMAYPTILIVTISYMIVIFVIGIVGLKVNAKE